MRAVIVGLIFALTSLTALQAPTFPGIPDYVEYLGDIGYGTNPGTQPETELNNITGVQEGAVDRDGNTDLDYSSPGNPLATFECNINLEGWNPCPANGVFSGLTNLYRSVQVRAVSGGTPDPSPATRVWTNFICAGTDIGPGDNIRTKIEGTLVNNKACILAGDYVIGTTTASTINVGGEKDLQGQPGPTMTIDTTPTGSFKVPIPGPQFPVDITDGTLNQQINTGGCAEVVGGEPERILSGSGAVSGAHQVEWIGFGGADAKVNGSGSGSFCGGSGVGFAIGGWVEPTMSYVWGHDNGLQATGTTDGIVQNSVFHDNGIEKESLGFGGGTQKSVTEYEYRYNFAYHNQGNGQWCDHSNGWATYTQETNGCWVHHNVSVDNERFGFRYEYWPRFAPTQTMQNAVGMFAPYCTDPSGTGGPGQELKVPTGYAEGTSCHKYPTNTQSFTHADMPGAVYENNYAVGNDEGGLVFQAAQNGLMMNNRCGQLVLEELPASIIGPDLRGATFNEWDRWGYMIEDRTFETDTRGSTVRKCIQSTQSAGKQTDTWNNDLLKNNGRGEDGGVDEGMQGCNNAGNGFNANAVTYCNGNVNMATGFAGWTSTNDATDAANAWDTTNNNPEYQSTQDDPPEW